MAIGGPFFIYFFKDEQCLINNKKKARDIMAEELVICPECGLEIRLSKIEDHLDMEKLEKKIIKESQQFCRSRSKEIRS